MIDRTLRIIGALASALLAALATSAGAQEGHSWDLEVGAFFTHHSNFFFRGEGQPRPQADLFSVYAHGERERKIGGGKLEVHFDLGGVETDDIEGADHVNAEVGGRFRRGSNRFSGETYMSPNQVYFDEDGVFFDLLGVELGWRRDLRRGLWVGVEVELESWDFDPVENARDSTNQELSASLRYPLAERFGVRGTVIYETRDADDPRFDLSGAGFAVALEAQPTDRINLFARYKRRARDYDDAPVGANNFQREDTIQDIVVNLRWRIGERWGLRLEDFFRDGTSTRADRNYSGNRISLGGFYQF